MLNKFIGAILGSALGDALGKNVEDLTEDEVLSYYGGRIEDFVEPHPSSPSYGFQPNQTSDETTITVLLLESIVEKKSLDIRDFLSRLIRWKNQEEVHRNPDHTLLQSLELIEKGLDPRIHGISSASVEGILRCLAVGLFHYDNPYIAAEGGRLVSLLTHYGEDIYDASAVYTVIISTLIQNPQILHYPKDLLDYIKSFAKGNRLIERLDTVYQLIEDDTQLEKALLKLGNSTHVLESFPLSLFIFLSNKDDPTKALFDAVNSYGKVGGDTDAISYLVGSMVGSCFGVEAFPKHILERLENLGYYIYLAEKLYELKQDTKGGL